MIARQGFQTTSARRLNLESPPMRLWQKAKKLGVWDPADLDFRQDAADWQKLDDLEQDVILRLTTLFQAGEEAVTLDLLPLIHVIASEGRLEEEMFLTSFLWEEAKHVESFSRFLNEVTGPNRDLSEYLTPVYRSIFYEALPEALGRLKDDPSPVAQAEASVTYNLIVEGVLAETGYHAYHEMLTRNGILPGMQHLTGLLKRDESRHIAYGVFLLSRLVAEHGEPVWNAIETRMNALSGPAIATVDELFSQYETLPFGLNADDFTAFAMMQFQNRVQRIAKAREQTLEDVMRAETEDEVPAPA